MWQKAGLFLYWKCCYFWIIWNLSVFFLTFVKKTSFKTSLISFFLCLSKTLKPYPKLKATFSLLSNLSAKLRTHSHTHTRVYFGCAYSKFEYLFYSSDPTVRSLVYVSHTDSVCEINKNVSKSVRSTRERKHSNSLSFEVTCTQSDTHTHTNSHSHAFAATHFCVRKGNTARAGAAQCVRAR